MRLSGRQEEIKELKKEEEGTRELDEVKKQWYLGKDGFWRWVIEKILHKKWLTNPTYAMRYLDTLSDEEKEKLKERWLKETKEYIEELKRKGLIY